MIANFNFEVNKKVEEICQTFKVHRKDIRKCYER